MAVLAIDLGASSGRGIVVTTSRGSMTCTEIHRFENGAFGVGEGLFWDVEKLFANIKIAIKKATEYTHIDSLAIDTWGVDYAFVGVDGKVHPAHSYRDKRTAGIIDTFSKLSKAELFALSGISLNEFNTTYQLSTERIDYDQIETFLFMPSLFSYLLTGKKGVEPTIASTSAFYTEEGFSHLFCNAIGLPTRVLPTVYATGSVLGKVSQEIKTELGLSYDIDVVLGAGHDTACAVASIPSTDGDTLFLSSGTWSLFGTELDAKNTSKEAFLAGFTNEIGVGSVRFLKNITGLWLIQECKKEWDAVAPITFADIVHKCKEAPKKGAFIDVTDHLFDKPDGMVDRIVAYAKLTQGIALESIGEIADTVYRSLAMEYKYAFKGLKSITGRDYPVLHVIGGGANNSYLNQLTADALGIPVVAGPTEATAIGNAVVQMIATGRLKTLKEARALIKRAIPLKTYRPKRIVTEEEYAQYIRLKTK